MDPKARDRRLRGLGPEPVGGAPPVSVTGARPSPALAAGLGTTATPTTSAGLGRLRILDTGAQSGNEEESAEPVTVLMMGRRNIDVSDPPPDGRGGARPPPPERGGGSVRPRGRVPDHTRRQGRRGGLRGADRLRGAEVGDDARPARVADRSHQPRSGRADVLLSAAWTSRPRDPRRLRLTQARIGDTLHDGNGTQVAIVDAFTTVNRNTDAIVRALDYQVVGSPEQFRVYSDDVDDVAR